MLSENEFPLIIPNPIKISIATDCSIGRKEGYLDKISSHASYTFIVPHFLSNGLFCFGPGKTPQVDK